jgi:hypothetical protein
MLARRPVHGHGLRGRDLHDGGGYDSLRRPWKRRRIEQAGIRSVRRRIENALLGNVLIGHGLIESDRCGPTILPPRSLRRPELPPSAVRSHRRHRARLRNQNKRAVKVGRRVDRQGRRVSFFGAVADHASICAYARLLTQKRLSDQSKSRSSEPDQ